MDSIAHDIYYKKQTPSCAIFTATLIWNSVGHLLHKTNPDLSYFELSYVFWEHIDSVGRGTTVIWKKNLTCQNNVPLPIEWVITDHSTIWKSVGYTVKQYTYLVLNWKLNFADFKV